MKLWLLLGVVLTLQEGLSVLATLVRAYQLHYSVWLITLLWLVVTSFQIVFGYFLGKQIQKKFVSSKFELWVQSYAKKLEASIDTSGEKLALILMSSVVCPFIAAFLGSWLDISFASIFLFALLGDFFWYASTWATVVGALEILAKVKAGLLVVLGIAIVVVLISHFRKSKSS